MKLQKEKMHTEESTYIRIVSPHDVSNDNRSIFKFQLWKKEQTSLENDSLDVIFKKS